MEPDKSVSLLYRSYQADDEKAIIELAGVVYPLLDLDLAGWNWRYRDNPAGHALIELAWDGDLLIGHYALCPVWLYRGSRGELTYLSLLTMVHPDYREQGIFQELARRAYKQARQEACLVWGFPNQRSHRGFVGDLNWVDICEIPMMQLPLGDYPYDQSCPNIAEVREFDVRFDALWQKMREDPRFMTLRDSLHLQWRYVSNPMESYRILVYTEGVEILGYVVFKRYQEQCQIVDLFAIQDVKIGIQLVEATILLALQEAVQIRSLQETILVPPESINLWLNVNDPLHRMLERKGFCNGEPITYFGGTSFSPWRDVPEFRDWYVTMGDSDVF